MLRRPYSPASSEAVAPARVKDAKGLRCRLSGQPWAPADRLASFQTRSLDNLNESTLRRRFVRACQ